MQRKIRTRIGSIVLDGRVVYIESMVKLKTSFYKQVLFQALRLKRAGAEIIRFAVKDKEDVDALRKIKKHMAIPLIADIHFDYRLALECLDFIDCVRINPLNITSKKRIAEVAKKARETKKCIRIGVNSGGVRGKKDLERELEKKVEYGVKILEDRQFFDIIISAKSSSAAETIKINRFLAARFPYPFHIGITATGPGLFGIIKSSIGIGVLLNEGIGDTIRVSLTDTPLKEVLVSKYILQSLGKRIFFTEVISCPTCGRAERTFLSQVLKAAKIIEDSNIKTPLRIALMGCEVNGPGEAEEADIGFAFSQRWIVFFRKGKIINKIKREKFKEFLKEELRQFESRENAG